MTLSYQSEFSRLQAYFKQGHTFDIQWRYGQLEALLKLIEENEQGIATALADDLGKCETESWATEIGFTLGDINHTQKKLSSWMRRRAVSSPMVSWPARSYIQPEPLGTVLVIGAWNYPFQLIMAPLIAAIAAGNCIVVKPSELSPATSSLIATLIPRYLDSNAIVVVEGDKAHTSALLSLPFDHILYTGGEQVGKIVMRAAAEHLTPVTLELGGKSPCIVDKSANLTVTARRLVWGKWLNAGQTCIAPDYVLVEDSLRSALLDELKKVLVEQYGSTPLTNPDYSHIVNDKHLARLRELLADHVIALGGEVDIDNRRMAPTIVVDPPLDSALMTEEIFGPILPIVSVSDNRQAILFIKSRPKPLALYVFANDSSLVDEVSETVSAGSICVNDTMLFMANPELPFGGVGSSGMGRYHGQFGFDTFSHLKSVMRRSFWFDVPIRYAPYSAGKLKWLKRFM